MKLCIQTIGILAVAASISYGQEAPKKGGQGQRPDPATVFAKLDTDGNGFISLDEFKATPRAQKNPEKAVEVFNKMNADGSADGVSLEEFKANRPQRGGKGRPGKGAKPDAAPAPAPAE